jgi:hypothetical protein
VPCVTELEHLLLAGLPGSGHFFLHFVHGVGLELQELGALLGLLFPGLLLHKLFQLHGPGGVIFIVARHCGGFFAVVWKGGGGKLVRFLLKECPGVKVVKKLTVVYGRQSAKIGK